MEEIKKLILEADEVDTYQKIIEDFEAELIKQVNDKVEVEISNYKVKKVFVIAMSICYSILFVIWFFNLG